MSAHTPGPWQVVDGAIGERVPVVTDADDTMVARIPPGRMNAEADALLIAAAPDGYELALDLLTLHAACAAVDSSFLPDHIKARVEAYVAKAEGRS